MPFETVPRRVWQPSREVVLSSTGVPYEVSTLISVIRNTCDTNHCVVSFSANKGESVVPCWCPSRESVGRVAADRSELTLCARQHEEPTL